MRDARVPAGMGELIATKPMFGRVVSVEEVELARAEKVKDEPEDEREAAAEIRAGGKVLRVATEELTAQSAKDAESATKAAAGATAEGANRHHIREGEANIERVGTADEDATIVTVERVRRREGAKAEDHGWRARVNTVEVGNGEAVAESVTQVDSPGNEPHVRVEGGAEEVAAVAALDCEGRGGEGRCRRRGGGSSKSSGRRGLLPEPLKVEDRCGFILTRYRPHQAAKSEWPEQAASEGRGSQLRRKEGRRGEGEGDGEG